MCYRICKLCGATLDPGETCDCCDEKITAEEAVEACSRLEKMASKIGMTAEEAAIKANDFQKMMNATWSRRTQR